MQKIISFPLDSKNKKAQKITLDYADAELLPFVVHGGGHIEVKYLVDARNFIKDNDPEFQVQDEFVIVQEEQTSKIDLTDFEYLASCLSINFVVCHVFVKKG